MSHTEELVYVNAEDGLPLEGALIQPADPEPHPVAIVFVHGLTSKFYSRSMITLGRHLAERSGVEIVVDLERMGDLAVNIAERALDLNQSPPLPPVHDLTKLAQLCQDQLRAALDAFVDGDVGKAEAVIKADLLLDALYHKLFNDLLSLMMEDPRNIRRANNLLFVAKHLERLGDHATNVAEMVVYMVRGTDVRHPNSREMLPKPA